MSKKIKIEFEKGGSFEGILREDEAPETCKLIWDNLPLSSECIHGRIPGRPGKEIAVESNYGKIPNRENQTIYPDRGDITFWVEREGDFLQYNCSETIGIYYGVGHSRDQRGNVPITVFAQITPEQLDDLEVVGIRIWRKGGEKVKITRA